MKDNLFKKAAVFGDIHYGLKNNSRRHNTDCEEFVHWFIKQAKSENCETCIFMGDLQHHRSAVNVSTLNYLVSAVKLLSEAFENVYMLTGNHDLFYREKREIHCFPFAEVYKNVHIINDGPVEMGNVALVPWLVGDEWKQMKKLKSKYVFGHFELPKFMMNALVSMPDHGGLQVMDFVSPEYVFSGHFHKRQVSGKIHYIGSPFAHNYADVWDNDRGMMILEWDGEPRYLNWGAGPKYITINLSSLLKNPNDYLSVRTYCKVYLDIPITYEEANFIKETFLTHYKLRDITILPNKHSADSSEWSGTEDIEIENVDQIVYNQLQSVESDFIDNKKLMEIYSKL
jgi:DNA repair exonuclease SbcCD nuclease subunit